ncbi:MAG: hypothetical protein U5L45_05620 [Saprospiraceae bacterium]|nr:hypothetical protein [Saprospiraceae bacterium]
MEQTPRDAPDDAPDNTSKLSNNKSNNKSVLWLKRLGIGGFLFFLGKGLLWLFLGRAALVALCN